MTDIHRLERRRVRRFCRCPPSNELCTSAWHEDFKFILREHRIPLLAVEDVVHGHHHRERLAQREQPLEHLVLPRGRRVRHDVVIRFLRLELKEILPIVDVTVDDVDTSLGETLDKIAVSFVKRTHTVEESGMYGKMRSTMVFVVYHSSASLLFFTLR